MSATNAPAYCEIDDVQDALQEADAKMGDAALQDKFVESAIFAASRWLRGRANTHWYDSNAATSDLISTTAATKTNLILDIPSAAHEQRGQIFYSDNEFGPHRYVRTTQGPYAKVQLPAKHVQSIDVLEVVDTAGETEDWVASSDFSSGRGNAYFTTVEGGVRGESYLYIHAGDLPSKIRYEEALEVDVSYGLDWDSEPWDDVRRGVAQLAAAELVAEDNVIAQIPDNGQLVAVETQVQGFLNRALMGDPGYLRSYVASHPVA